MGCCSSVEPIMWDKIDPKPDNASLKLSANERQKVYQVWQLTCGEECKDLNIRFCNRVSHRIFEDYPQTVVMFRMFWEDAEILDDYAISDTAIVPKKTGMGKGNSNSRVNKIRHSNKFIERITIYLEALKRCMSMATNADETSLIHEIEVIWTAHEGIADIGRIHFRLMMECMDDSLVSHLGSKQYSKSRQRAMQRFLKFLYCNFMKGKPQIRCGAGAAGMPTAVLFPQEHLLFRSSDSENGHRKPIASPPRSSLCSEKVPSKKSKKKK